MAQLRVAAFFKEWDVDKLMAEMPADQYEEWGDFFALEPHGWQAANMTTARIAYSVFQSQSKRRLTERRFEIKLGAGLHTDAGEKVRWEAAGVESEVRENLARHARGEFVSEEFAELMKPAEPA